MKVLIVIIILVILYIIIKYEKTIDKFTMNLTPPKILKVQKDGFNAKVEWYHTNPDIQDYVLLYVDIAKLASGVWVQNNITCKTRRCKLVIQNLDGKRYKLAVLSKMNDKISDITPDDIITFGDDKPYDRLMVQDGETLVAEGDNEPLLNLNQNGSPSGSNNNSSLSPGSSTGNGNGNTDAPNSTPGPSPAPVATLDCDGGYVKLSNITNKEELEKAKVKPVCQEMEDLSKYMKKPWYHKYLDRVF